jgi:threonine/homoserine/homoserine lactone efflux protein
VAEIIAFWAFLPLFFVDAQENHGGMELLGIAVIILILAIITATISALRRDGLGHNPPVRSEDYWMARDLPSVNYTLRNF